MKPLHPQVRIVASENAHFMYFVEAFDGDVWERTHSAPLPLSKAEFWGRWLSDVLEHARDSALEEAALFVDVDDQQAADAIRRLKGPKT